MSYYLLEKIMYEKEMVRVHVQWTPFNLYSSYKRWSKKNRRNALMVYLQFELYLNGTKDKMELSN
jgi:hypothetical protein